VVTTAKKKQKSNLTRREEGIAKAIERKNPGISKRKKIAIAKATAKRAKSKRKSRK